MFYGFGQRQQELLKALMFKKNGLTIDAMAQELGITRTAVQQHLSALENGGYIEKGSLVHTGGRPSQVYVLTKEGVDLFPKQYSWFSELLLHSLKAEFGNEALEARLVAIGRNLAENLKSKIAGMTPAQQVTEATNILCELGYEAKTSHEKNESLPVINAHNCVYHHLAKDIEAVCKLDCSFLETLLDREIIHAQCIAKGGDTCQFLVRERKSHA